MDRDSWELLAIAFGMSLLLHAVIRNFVLATIVVCLLGPTICTADIVLRSGLPLIPANAIWIPLGLIVYMFYSLPVAIIIGLPFLLWRRHSTRRVAP